MGLERRRRIRYMCDKYSAESIPDDTAAGPEAMRRGDDNFLLAPLVEIEFFDDAVELLQLDRGIVALDRNRPAGIFRRSIRFAAVLCRAPAVVGEGLALILALMLVTGPVMRSDGHCGTGSVARRPARCARGAVPDRPYSNRRVFS